MMRQLAGSALFTTILFVSVAIWAWVCIALRIFGYRAMFAGIELWAKAILAALRWCCRLDYSVRGLERLPASNTVILVKHSSAWETIAQLVLFPSQTWVMKRELIWAPVLGWALFLLKPIAINRGGGRNAVNQVIELGQARLKEGLWIMIFPEGTRVPVGQMGRFGLSGILLAQAAGKPVVPVAHDAGRYWPRRGLLKKSGTIQVVIGNPIPTTNRDPRELADEIKTWMETTIAEMTGPEE
jgi:1-acyl-sn-glycerol-3-phosphate acyltransferase